MNLLIVCSGNKNKINAFISEQVAALEQRNQDTHYFFVRGKGVLGYLRNFILLKRNIKKHKIDLVHAHYGLSGMLAVLQRKIPVVITFHGSDVNQTRIRRFSCWASKMSSHNIIVEKSFISKLNLKNNFTLLPCGVDILLFQYKGKEDARLHLQMDKEEQIVLFASSFNNPVKNYSLAREAMEKVPAARLVELAGYTREEISLLMNAADLLLLTSFSEGSPQVVKEALACNLPVVSTPVGDVPDLLKGVDNSIITPYDSGSIAEAIKNILSRKERSSGRDKIIYLDNRIVAGKLINIYQSVINKRNA